MDEQIYEKLVLSVGTQVVTRVDVKGCEGYSARPKGAVGVIVKSPMDNLHSYVIRFPDGVEASFKRNQVTVLKHQSKLSMLETASFLETQDLYQFVVYRCIVGSRAYGLAIDESDEDRRGIYLPPAKLHWSLFGVPEQLEDTEHEACYWELQKFLTLALNGNPNILECLYTPIVEMATPLVQELLGMREIFLSKHIYKTFNGYALSQFRKMEQDIRNHGEIRWKHAMHLIRLLYSGIKALREGSIFVDISERRTELLSIRSGEMLWEEVNSLRLNLHKEFDEAFMDTKLPERPDYEAVNDFLLKARRSKV